MTAENTVSPRERRWVGRFVRATWFSDRKGGPWSIPESLPHEDVRFEGNSGATLAGRWFPADEPRGVVVLVHPDRRYAQHWFVREGWVGLLHAEGYDVLTFDLAAYGQSRGGSTYFHEDVLAAVRLAERYSGGLPIHVVGLSIGAFAVANASPFLHRVQSLVLESPYPSFTEWERTRRGRFALSLFARAFPRTNAMLDARANLARASAKRILVAASLDDAVTPASLSHAVAHAANPARTRMLDVAGVAHLALFRESAEYREAVLATLAGDAGRRAKPTIAERPPLVS